MRHNEYAFDFVNLRGQADIDRLDIENWLVGKIGELAFAFQGVGAEQLPAVEITACRRALIEELEAFNIESKLTQGVTA